MPKRISHPPGWNKTYQDLRATKQFPSPLEIEWALSYEQSQLKKWARFPRDGEIYEALDRVEVRYEIDWNAPVGWGGTGTIAKGTRVRVSVMAEDSEPIAVSAVPLEYDRIEQELVPEWDRTQSKYAGFHLALTTSDLNRLFRRVLGDEPRIVIPTKY